MDAPVERATPEEGDNSQASQEVYDAFMKYGIGMMSSSPPKVQRQATPPQNKTSRKIAPASSGSSLNPQASARRTRDVSEGVNPRSPVSSRSEEGQNLTPQELGERQPKASGDNAASQSVPADAVAEPSATHEDGRGRPAKRRKMASSQSPTQSNDGRSYEQYLHSSTAPRLVDDSDSVPGRPTQESAREEAILEEDDAGLVKFDFDAVRSTDKTASSIQDESSIVDVLRSMVGQQPPPFPPFPETPAPPQNPFRQSRSQLLAPSQLFGGTQFSSAIKHGSPTSSRPSPDDFHQPNSISPNPPFVSSPLKARGLRSTPTANFTSSPGAFPRTVSHDVHDAPSSPPRATSNRNPIIPDSQSSRLRKKGAPEPMSTYEPMHKSQERRSTSLARSLSGSSEDEDDSIARRRKAKLRKEAALEQLTAINFAPPAKSDDIEVPSTNQRRRRAEAEGYLAQGYGAQNAHSNGQEAVVDSQEKRTASVEQASLPNQEPTQSTQSDADENAEPSSVPDTAPRMPLPRMSPPLVLTRRLDYGTSADAIPETSPAVVRTEDQVEIRPALSDTPLAMAKPAPNFQFSPPAFSTRSKRSRAQGSSSSLSNLATTPVLSASATPANQSPGMGERSEHPVVVPSRSPFPVPARDKRRDAVGKLSRLSAKSADNLRASTRTARRLSSSTDERPRSATATPTFEQSLRMSRASMTKSSRATGKAQQASRGPKIFEGMAFAISFQSRKSGETNDQYNTRMEFAGTIERRIKQAGGKVLDAGFDELFDVSAVKSVAGSPSSTPNPDQAISLTEAGRETGFTALIADGHSRKVKYMQALALGLPCIASRWITSCLDRGEITDWTPYLLCAGQSAFLGDAIRSRNLTPYDASTARLADVVESRAKFLQGSKVLLVVKKALEGEKRAYVFLARVLGASVTRVHSVEEAKAEAKAAEDAGKPFGWVYVDGKEDAGDLVAGSGTSGGGKKRKRATSAAQTAGNGPARKKMRTLSDELVIQSLILGRMIEEGEMDG